MNIDEVRKMSPEEKTIAVAQCLGWKPKIRKMYAGEKNAKGWEKDGEFVKYWQTFPNWRHDPMPMRDAALKIPHDKQQVFARTLCELAIGQPVTTEKLNLFEVFLTATAEPEMYCDAFLATMLP